ncbi:LPS export ABC transporter periplasmic protein LptC [Capnocytophaga sp. ARDL2]|uniref:LPS export ABC transporter periplasmic protein LptC n=1 Tax=Capnocytophaga sp. ARDL2 TaxID=3238809 RepID=UPI003557596A
MVGSIKYEISKVAIKLFALLSILACDSDTKEIQNIHVKRLHPDGEAEKFVVKYTEEGKIKAQLNTEKMLDYSSAKSPFNLFPKKVFVTIFDENKNKTEIQADRGFSYNKTQIIELTHNVKIKTHDGKLLETQQLFYDQKNQWFFTDHYFKLTTKDKSYFEGIGVDFDSDFKVFNAQQNRGELNNISNENL